MKHSTRKPTKPQLRRFLKLYELGCIACRSFYHVFEPCQIHHILSGGKRIGHDATIPLCPWHHMGNVIRWGSVESMEGFRGPSMALNKRAFVKTFGTEKELLAMTNLAIEDKR